MRSSILLTMLMILCLFASTSVLAQIDNGNKKFLDMPTASKQFKLLHGELTNTGLNANNILIRVNKLEVLADRAETCIEKSKDQLKKIRALLKSAAPVSPVLQQDSDYSYFQEKQAFYAKQLSECLFFKHRVSETLTEYKVRYQQLSTYKIFHRDTPIWKIHEKEILASLANVKGQMLFSVSGINEISFTELMVGLLLIAFGAAIGLYIRRLCCQWLSAKQAHSSLLALFSVIADFILPIIVLITLTLFFSAAFSDLSYNPVLELISYSLLLFFLFFALSKYLFDPPSDIPSPIGLSNEFGSMLHNRIVALLSWLLLGSVFTLVFNGQLLSLELVELARTVFITVLGALIFWIFLSACQLPRLKALDAGVILSLKAVIYIVLLSMIGAEWLGYHQLAVYLIRGVLSTVVIFLIAIGAFQLIGIFFQVLSNNEYMVARRLKHFLGIKLHRDINEIVIIKFLVYFVLFSLLLVFLMASWGVSINLIDAITGGLLKGFMFAGLKITPYKLIIALFSFSIILLLGRLFATSIARRQQFRKHADTQVAVSSILVYVSFAVALLFALLLLGVDFTGLAIIAGALSVGIGLGLQNIVNNFVSGLILLLEKPIKPGDRVVVGDIEGFVKKIRIRSTQITTLAKEDVIVPNSELVLNKVTNYMFRDHFWRVVCQVGVAYGSDVELVKKVLLEVASQHPDVIQEEPNKPTALFRSFGDSSLNFELWCIINDVNKKFAITSDLNFAIDQAFRQHKITIAFPQRDVHIKGEL